MNFTNNMEVMGVYKIQVHDKNGLLKVEREGHNLLLDSAVYSLFEIYPVGQTHNTTCQSIGAFILSDIDRPIALDYTGNVSITQSNNTITTSPLTDLGNKNGWTIHYAGDITSQYDAKIIESPATGVYTVDRSQNITNPTDFKLIDTRDILVEDIDGVFYSEFTNAQCDVTTQHSIHSDVITLSSIKQKTIVNNSGASWNLKHIYVRFKTKTTVGQPNRVFSRFSIPPTDIDFLDSVTIKYTFITKYSSPTASYSNNSITGTFNAGRSNFQHRLSASDNSFSFPLPNSEMYLVNPNNFSERIRQINYPNYYSYVKNANASSGPTGVYRVSAYFINQGTNSFNFNNTIHIHEGWYNTGVSDVPAYQLTWNGDPLILEPNEYLKMVFEWNLRRIILD